VTNYYSYSKGRVYRYIDSVSKVRRLLIRPSQLYKGEGNLLVRRI
jgi:hypothetical protein